MNSLQNFLQLIRFNKPIGSLLLLWPTWAALSLSCFEMGVRPNLWVWIIFTVGVVLMRSVGCIINDIADRNFDKFVARTQARPITSGKVSVGQAMIWAFSLTLIAFILVCFTNLKTILLSTVALGLAVVYPFMKRITHFPQVVLGIAFAWAIPMAYMAQTEQISAICWWLFAGTVFWAVAYDTLYALVDKVDDLKIGIKSTAILFSEKSHLVVATCHIITLLCYGIIGYQLNLNLGFFVCIVLAGTLAFYQQLKIQDKNPKHYFQAFLDNNYFGALLCFGAIFGALTST